MDEAQTSAFLRELPKADLHVHFEGTVTSEMLDSLAKRHNIALDAPVQFDKSRSLQLPDLQSDGRWNIKSFMDFIAVYRRTTECIRDADDVINIGIEYLTEAKRQNIQYSEIYFSPTSFAQIGIDLREVFSGLLYIECCAPEYNTELSWVFDVVRNVEGSAEAVMEHAMHARNVGLSVNAIGLAGYEQGYPASQFAGFFTAARQEGFTVLAHAGETTDASYIRDTLDALSPKRIGHGIKIVEDPELVKQAVEKDTPFEVCPCSNVALKICKEQDHPLAQMINAGLLCVICSDDPGIFRRDLCDNYLFAAQQGVSPKDLAAIASQSLSPALRSHFAKGGHDVYLKLHPERSNKRKRAMASSRRP
jgi:adenosine deaminase